jgi:hypothetical protein
MQAKCHENETCIIVATAKIIDLPNTPPSGSSKGQVPPVSHILDEIGFTA